MHIYIHVLEMAYAIVVDGKSKISSLETQGNK